MNATPHFQESLADRAAQSVSDFWVTLGRAFLPPLEVNHWRALQADLPLDLEDWSRDLGLGNAASASGLLESMAAYPEHEDLLAHYSALFYSPPIRVHLNLGMHLDGSLNGPAQDGLARWHSAYGLDRSPTFHDLTDHLAAVLEFLGLVARLEENQLAAEFAHTYLLPALPRIIRAMELEGALSSRSPGRPKNDLAPSGGGSDVFSEPGVQLTSPYLWLLRYLNHALALLYPAPEAEPASAKPRYRAREIGDGWRHCRQCDQPIATEKELAVMEKALVNAGLPSNHLHLCPDCRESAQGWEHRALPKGR